MVTTKRNTWEGFGLTYNKFIAEKTSLGETL